MNPTLIGVVLLVLAISWLAIQSQSHSHSHIPPGHPAESFGNADYYLRGDGTWTASQMAGATPQSSGTTGMAPAPTAGQQNSYLRGDGTWQQANNAPTATAVLYSTCVADQTIYANTFSSATGPFQIIYFDTPVVSGSPNIAQNTLTQSKFSNAPGTTFMLAPGCAYKLTGSIGYTTVNGAFQWFNITTNALIGIACNTSGGGAVMTVTQFNNSVVAFVTTASAAATVALVGTQVSNGTLYGAAYKNSMNSLGWGPYVTIEQVSNNNTIGPFGGATSSTNGVVGYIPAPPAGTQNSYLRGDGNWVQANNAPTAAIIMHAIYVAAQNTPVPTTNGVAFPFNTIAFSTGTSGVITPSPNATNITTFVLAPGNTYKCTAQIGYSTGTTYQWSTVPYVAGTTTLFGVIGDMNSSTTRSATAIGYITVSTTTTISLIVLTGAGADRVGTGNPGGGIINAPWATIEVVSNNAVITQFAGATASAGGTSGYMPAPVAGQQNSYLRGDGTWVQANNAPTAAIAMHVACVAEYNKQLSAVNGLAFPFNTVTFSTGTTGVITPSPSTTNITTFALAAGYTYKCVAQIGKNNTGEFFYQWSTVPYVAGTTTVFGVMGTMTNLGMRNSTAIGYITTSAPTTIALISVYSANDVVTGNVPGFPNLPWATIEVVSNNNTITAFSGATASSAGAIGYVPAPPTGTQNAYLRGDGTWQSPYVGMVQQAVNATTSPLYYPGTAWMAVPGMTLTVTPISAASQFLVRANINFAVTSQSDVLFRFMRGTTPIGINNASSGLVGSFRSNIVNAAYSTTASGEILDAPATTAATTYSLQCITYSPTYGVMFNNSTGGAAGTVDTSAGISTLTITQC